MRLPTNFHYTMEVSKRLEVDFQQISTIPWKCPKGWKLTSNKFPLYHGSVQKVGSWLPTNFHTMELSKRLAVDFQQISIPWNCPKGWQLTSNKFPYHGIVQKVGSWLPTNFHTMELSKRLAVDFQQISIPWKCPKGWQLTSNKFPYHGIVQKVGSWLPTNFHTMELSKRLEVDFQQISIPWNCPKGWQLTSNKFPYHGIVQKVGSWLPTNFHTMELSKRLAVDFQQISIPWNCPKGWQLTSNKFPYHGRVQKVGSIMEICWKSQWFPWSGEDTIFPVMPGVRIGREVRQCISAMWRQTSEKVNKFLLKMTKPFQNRKKLLFVRLTAHVCFG